MNVANRMEAFGSPGRIQITEDVHQQLKHQYLFEKRRTISVKGTGKWPSIF